MFSVALPNNNCSQIFQQIVTNILFKNHSVKLNILRSKQQQQYPAAETRCHPGPLASIPGTVPLLVKVPVTWPNPIRRYFRKLLLATRGKKARKFANFLLTFSANENLRIWPLFGGANGMLKSVIKRIRSYLQACVVGPTHLILHEF